MTSTRNIPPPPPHHGTAPLSGNTSILPATLLVALPSHAISRSSELLSCARTALRIGQQQHKTYRENLQRLQEEDSTGLSKSTSLLSTTLKRPDMDLSNDLLTVDPNALTLHNSSSNENSDDYENEHEHDSNNDNPVKQAIQSITICIQNLDESLQELSTLVHKRSIIGFQDPTKDIHRVVSKFHANAKDIVSLLDGSIPTFSQLPPPSPSLSNNNNNSVVYKVSSKQRIKHYELVTTLFKASVMERDVKFQKFMEVRGTVLKDKTLREQRILRSSNGTTAGLEDIHKKKEESSVVGNGGIGASLSNSAPSTSSGSNSTLLSKLASKASSTSSSNSTTMKSVATADSTSTTIQKPKTKVAIPQLKVKPPRSSPPFLNPVGGGVSGVPGSSAVGGGVSKNPLLNPQYSSKPRVGVGASTRPRPSTSSSTSTMNGKHNASPASNGSNSTTTPYTHTTNTMPAYSGGGGYGSGYGNYNTGMRHRGGGNTNNTTTTSTQQSYNPYGAQYNDDDGVDKYNKHNNNNTTANDTIQSQIEQRRQSRQTQSRLDEARQAESKLAELTTMFGKMSTLIQSQGETLTKIEDDVEVAMGHVEAGSDEIGKLYDLKKGNRSLIVKVFAILIFFIVFMKWY